MNLKELLPDMVGHEAGFRDALEAVIIAMRAAGMPTDDVVQTVLDAYAYNADETPRPDWVMVCPVISTAHIQAGTLEALRQSDALKLASVETGAFVFIGDTTAADWQYRETIPELLPILEWFRKAYPEETWLRFDADGGRVEGLPMYDDEPQDTAESLARQCGWRDATPAEIAAGFLPVQHHSGWQAETWEDACNTDTLKPL